MQIKQQNKNMKAAAAKTFTVIVSIVLVRFVSLLATRNGEYISTGGFVHKMFLLPIK